MSRFKENTCRHDDTEHSNVRTLALSDPGTLPKCPQQSVKTENIILWYRAFTVGKSRKKMHTSKKRLLCMHGHKAEKLSGSILFTKPGARKKCQSVYMSMISQCTVTVQFQNDNAQNG